MKKLVVLRGIPGSGKSQKAREIATEYKGTIVSVDNYFERNGEYKFLDTEISRAYGYVEGQVDILMQQQTQLIIADGIHQSEKHLRGYQALADKYGYELEIQYPDGEHIFDVEHCFRHSIHRVPRRTLQKIKDRFERENIAA